MSLPGIYAFTFMANRLPSIVIGIQCLRVVVAVIDRPAPPHTSPQSMSFLPERPPGCYTPRHGKDEKKRAEAFPAKLKQVQTK